MTAITEEEVVAAALNEVVAHALAAEEDPLAHERIWERLYWLLSPRGQTGYASHAIAALDVALWDLKGKQLGQPLWRLLGAARSRGPGLHHLRLRRLQPRRARRRGEMVGGARA